MKKVVIIAVLACVAMATDFSKMTTDQLMNMRGKVDVDSRPAFQQEVQKRMQSMTPAQRQNYMKSNRSMRMGKNPMRMPTFADIDTNKNGMISPKEFQKHQSMQMGRMKNTCEYRSKGMMGARGKSMMKMPTFGDFDLNNDGYIIEGELQEARNKRMTQNAEEGKMMKNASNAPSFSEMDTDKNGKISPKEFQQYQNGRMQSPKY
jgi:Ca2+-binding EF-hand superfamily protein